MTTLTRWGHACVRIERPDHVLVIDPGVWSDVEQALADADAVLVTHDHPDHLDVAAVVAVAELGAEVLAPEPVVSALREAGAPEDRVRAVTPGERLTVAGFDVHVLGGEHAVIHPDLPAAVNNAYLVDGVVLHPGDSWTVPPEGTQVDVLLVPLGGPWVRVADAIDLVRAVRPRVVVGIHDAVLSDVGRGLASTLVGNLGGAGDVVLSAPGQPIGIGDDVPVLEDDETVPPRPEEEVADVARSRPDPEGHGG